MTDSAENDRTPHTHGGTDAPECTPYGIKCPPAENERLCRECGHRLGDHSGLGNCLAVTRTALTSAVVERGCPCPGYAPIPPGKGDGNATQ